ncbi:toprim domain-containing protein [Nocardia salmonicida]|uniref:toprim domain-containing protein n=1 Tax=Nocardia salmonicida TaxID=53431 RepID=UPI0033EFD658
MTVAGGGTRLYNTRALLQPVEDIAVCEGEFDALASTFIGVPAVGVPGAQTWLEHWREPILGYRNAWVPYDGDKAGREFAEKMAKVLPNAKLLPMPPGHDLSSFIQAEGKEAFLAKMSPTKS